MRLPSKSISFTDFEACIDSILEKLATPGLEAAKLDHETRLDFKMETLSSLDNYFGGGLPCKRVIEISGDKGSGKSVLLLNCVLTSLLKDKDISALVSPTPNNMEIILQRLHISTAVDIESVQEIIRALDVQLAHQESIPRMRCIVIDPVTPLLSPYLSAVSSQGHAIMSAFMRYLHDLAARYSLLVLVVNNATLMRARSTNRAQMPVQTVSNPLSAFASTIRKPALGPSFAFMTDATLWVSLWPEKTESEERSTAHVIEVFRSKFSVSNVWSPFRINSSGVLLAD
ncbi:P-loop containing nucleoside triphosphate hydrolase protein [Lentinula edodes]|uniref:p-loop containing nucleoside triphosphate hydrolase protein n=1 Tax=Lentinula edodes TaxID=5353 RepID=A0A1Q3E5L3_LENED|nr:P-loop containing nucleoside triphosphate hydrolase protein [Lentinula edodes]